MRNLGLALLSTGLVGAVAFGILFFFSLGGP